jgi:DNA-binding NtrC family response regulator
MDQRHVQAKGMPRRPEGPAAVRRLLVIDQDISTRKALSEQLAALGFIVMEEDTGISGLSRLTYDAGRSSFHGVLVELQMPMLGGLAVIQEMNERFPMVPVIAMSDVQHVAKLRQAVKAGAKEYLIKPFDPELLRRKCLHIFLNNEEA